MKRQLSDKDMEPTNTFVYMCVCGCFGEHLSKVHKTMAKQQAQPRTSTGDPFTKPHDWANLFLSIGDPFSIAGLSEQQGSSWRL